MKLKWHCKLNSRALVLLLPLLFASSAIAGGPPSNDDCANAIEIFEGDTTFCNFGATQYPDNTCTFLDVWFRFEAPCSGALTLSTETPGMQNSTVAIYSPNLFGTCTCPPGGGTFGGGQLLACGLTPTVNVVAGSCYYISVGGTIISPEGCGTLTLQMNIESGDSCGVAIPVAEGETPFCNFGAFSDPPFSDNCFPMFNDIWFEYTPNCTGNITASVCTESPFDSTLAIYGPGFGGSSCVNPPFQNGVLLGCITGDCAGQPPTLTVPVIGGSLYKIRIGTSVEQTSGVLTLSHSVPNDACLGAILIGAGDTPFCTIAATEGRAEDSCAAFADPGPDIWFRHMALCTGTLLVSTCNQANFNTKLAVYQGCTVSPPAFNCNLNTLLGCNDNVFDCPGGTSELAVPVTEGMCYRIRLGSASNQSGTGVLSLSYIGCTPPNPCPADIAPPKGNGVVDVDDLLLVINNWGACAGCAADITGNGIVDVDDLLAVINAWGPCK